MKKKNGKIWAVWAFLVIVLILIIYAIPFFETMFKRTYTLEKEILEITERETVYLARDEIVYGAPYTGQLEYLASEGELKKKGTKIVNMSEIVTDETENENNEYEEIIKHLGENMKVMDSLESERKGIVSYYVDGNEGIVNQQSIYEFTEKELNLVLDNITDLSRKTAKKGEPIFKIVDNSSWGMVFWTEVTKHEKYIEGDRVTVDFGEDDVRATVEQVSREGDKLKVILSTNRYYNDFAKDREATVEIIIDEKEGLLAKKRSLVVQDDVLGIYVLNTLGDEKFVPVSVIIEEDDNVLIREEVFYDDEGAPIETVLTYQEVLANPPK